MEQILQTIIIGLANGLIFALVALGYTLVYGIIELINFAHGDVFMLGSFIALVLISTVFALTATTPLLLMAAQILIVLGITMLATAAINVSIERVAYRPLRNAPKLAPLISAIGMSFVLQNIALLIFGPANDSVNSILPNVNVLSAVGITAVTISVEQVFVAVVTIPLLIALTWFVSKTRQGKAMRATAQDPEAARLMGINVDTTISLTFLLGGLLAGAAGLINTLYQTSVWYFQGFTAGLIAFTAAVMGGIGNLRGAVLGGFIIGCIQQISDNRIGNEWTPAVIFAYLVLIMTFRPQGLLGEETREAG
jgi:branched-chain amino acid transport system permease protein